MHLPPDIDQNLKDEQGNLIAWTTHAVHDRLAAEAQEQVLRTTERALQASNLLPDTRQVEDVRDENDRAPRRLVVENLEKEARRKRWQSLVLQEHQHGDTIVLFANDARAGRRWVYLPPNYTNEELLEGIDAIAGGKSALLWPHGALTARLREIVGFNGTHKLTLKSGKPALIGTVAYHGEKRSEQLTNNTPWQYGDTLSHLDRLEAESIHIMREVVAQADNPVMLYSVGKDSSVMLHLARKAFYPSPPPFPLLHVDTRWKFQAMYQFRDAIAAEVGMDLIVHINPEGVEKDINPFDHGSVVHTDMMKTEGLKQALNQYGFDVAFGGARRDEEKSRAKERIFSFRNPAHRWDPKNQRPELWRLYNGFKKRGESIRVFPLSNWTELDIWQYLYREQVPIVPLYFAAERPVVERDGMLIMVDDDRMRLLPDEQVELRKIRFRTLGCYPLTGAIESDADDLSSIVLELLESRTSERQGRAIDSDATASMEKKKQEGYF